MYPWIEFMPVRMNKHKIKKGSQQHRLIWKYNQDMEWVQATPNVTFGHATPL